MILFYKFVDCVLLVDFKLSFPFTFMFDSHVYNMDLMENQMLKNI